MSFILFRHTNFFLTSVETRKILLYCRTTTGCAKNKKNLYQFILSSSARDGLGWRFPPSRTIQVTLGGSATCGGLGAWFWMASVGVSSGPSIFSITQQRSSTASSNMCRSSEDFRASAHQVVDMTIKNIPFWPRAVNFPHFAWSGTSLERGHSSPCRQGGWQAFHHEIHAVAYPPTSATWGIRSSAYPLFFTHAPTSVGRNEVGRRRGHWNNIVNARQEKEGK